MSLKFTFQDIELQYSNAKQLGYEFITCEDYYHRLNSGNSNFNKTVVNRVDIDFSVKKTKTLVEIFNRLEIKATFFLRLHAPEYNPFSFENYKIIKSIVESGHELGYHSEIIDQSVIWNEKPEECLTRDIDVINKMFDVEIKGIASHGGMTGLNNLDFWKNHRAEDFGLLYETYDNTETFKLFNTAFYISDSEWIRWKCYDKGKRVEGDERSFIEHLTDDEHQLVYLLIHPDTYYKEHIYE